MWLSLFDWQLEVTQRDLHLNASSFLSEMGTRHIWHDVPSIF